MLEPYFQKGKIEAGCDEAGRGCLAGPVFAAAVILPADFKHEFLNDSKQLTEAQRDELRPIIEEQAIAWHVAKVTPKKIDKINILNASILGMHMAVKKLGVQPDSLLIDGNRFKPFPGIPHFCVIKGDGKFMSIAAASVLAKTHRDEYMLRLHRTHPQYSWNTNKGYPTQAHRKAIADHGPTRYHRKSFRLLRGVENGRLFE